MWLVIAFVWLTRLGVDSLAVYLVENMARLLDICLSSKSTECHWFRDSLLVPNTTLLFYDVRMPPIRTCSIGHRRMVDYLVLSTI